MEAARVAHRHVFRYLVGRGSQKAYDGLKPKFMMFLLGYLWLVAGWKDVVAHRIAHVARNGECRSDKAQPSDSCCRASACHVLILEMNGESFRLKQSKTKNKT